MPTNTSNTPNTAEIAAQAHAFLAPFKSLILSTVDAEQQPHISYAPVIRHQQKFYVYVSALAKHSQTLAGGQATVLFIQDESQSKNIFARLRLTMQCDVLAVEKGSPAEQLRLDQFEAEHGKTVGVLRGLPDFQLYELQPQSAWYVTGFGAAHDIYSELNTLLAI